jgi:hypothetical protein
MTLNVSDTGGGDFKQVDQGTHMAICNMVVDLGIQDTPYGTKHQLYIRWELPNERLEWEKDGEKLEGPMSIGSFYTASLSEKANLRRDLEGWRGRAFTPEELEGFDVFNVLGKGCQVSIIHNDNLKARVKGVSGWPKGVDKKEAENPLMKYSKEDPQQHDSLPEWLREIIGKQLEVAPAVQAEPAPFDDALSDIPF